MEKKNRQDQDSTMPLNGLALNLVQSSLFCLMRLRPGIFGVFFEPRHKRIVHDPRLLSALLAEDLALASGNAWWWAGCLAYEAAGAFESSVQDFMRPPEGGLARWGLFSSCMEVSDGQIPQLAQALAGCLNAQAENLDSDAPAPSSVPAGFSWPRVYIAPFVPDWDFPSYESAFARVQCGLEQGRSYQMNLTCQLRAIMGDTEGQSSWSADSSSVPREPGFNLAAAFLLWSDLLSQGQSAHAAFWYQADDLACIASLSPELFFSKTGHTLETRPMKGTAARHSDPETDSALASGLEKSEKNRAENLMIVDMIRNDLGRIAVPGSVVVKKLFQVETYPSVHQMTSTIEAKTGKDIPAILAALFPCASITGAPKISTIRALADIELCPRGWYTGSAGWVDPKGDAWFNVLIRTLVLDRQGGVSLGVGGGVVWDSTARDEYGEALLKSRFTQKAMRSFDLVESLRWTPPGLYTRATIQGPDGFVDIPDPSGFWFLDSHARRLCHGAARFGMPMPRDSLKAELERWMLGEGQSFAAEQKVRVSLDPQGRFTIQTQELSLPFNSEPSVKVALAVRAVPDEPEALSLMTAKTSNRALHHDLDRPGFSQTIYYAPDGRITESSTCNVVLHLDGCWLTPRCNGFFLLGTYRQHLLDAGRIQEAELNVSDLYRAEAIWLVNSVRGWIPAVLETVPISCR